MNTQEFLTENREEVIAYFNVEIKNSWNISLSAFMKDLMNNFEKITLASIEGYTLMDLSGNLKNAKSRLGMFDNRLEVKFDRDNYIANKYKNTVFAQNLAL